MMELTKINTFWLVLNYICNNRCLGCHASQSGYLNKPMTVENAIFIMKMMKEQGAKDCLLIGGEPTLFPELERVIQCGTDMGIDVKIVTNGRKLANRDFFNNIVMAGLKHASISIEGATAQNHNSITGTNSFDDVIQAIEHCIHYNLSFNTLLTISKANCHEIVALAKMLHEMGVQNILFNVGLPSSEEIDNIVDDNFSLPPDEIARIIEQSYLDLKKIGIKVKFFATIPLCLFNRELLQKMLDDDYITDGIHCHIYFGTGVVFEPNGDVLPCTHFVGAPLFNLNNEKIKTLQDFQRVWYNKKGIHGTFKKRIWSYRHESCVKCEFWGKCIGGCPFLWVRYNPEDYIPIRRK